MWTSEVTGRKTIRKHCALLSQKNKKENLPKKNKKENLPIDKGENVWSLEQVCKDTYRQAEYPLSPYGNWACKCLYLFKCITSGISTEIYAC